MSRIYSASHSPFHTSQRGKSTHNYIILAVLTLDLGAILLASPTAEILSCLFSPRECRSSGEFFLFGMLFGTIMIFCFIARGMYEIDRIASPLSNSSDIIFFSSGIIIIISGILFILSVEPSFPRISLLLFGMTAPTLIIVQRTVVAGILTHAHAHGKLASRTVVLVLDSTRGSLPQNLDCPRSGYRVLRSFVVPPTPAHPGSSEEWTVLTRQVIEYLQHSHVDVVYINVDWTQYTGLKILIAALQREPVAVRIFPDATMMGSLKRPHMSSDGSLALEVQRPPMTATASLQKRILDLTFSILALTAFLPIIAIIGLAIRLDSGGPVIFRQTRRGFKDSVFRIYKFRTMTVLEDGPMVTQAKHNDPRVTRVGRLLRRTSLDELPQLLNVIKGDMSLVGPRPHAVAHDIEFDRLVSGYELRSYVKPGITGWAQVHGMRGETSTIDLIRKRVDLDIYYVRNHTLLLDIEILAKTIVHLFRHYNAE